MAFERLPTEYRTADVLEVWRAMGRGHLAPKRVRSVSEWADAERWLVAETSAEAGFWRTARAPMQKEIMDAFSDDEVREITLCTATQVGKTEMILNMVGRTIDDDPAPTMIVLPRDEDAKAWAVKRVKTMVLASDALRQHTTGVEDDLAGKLYRFDHMFLKFAGANSPADLASDPCKNVLFDEVEKYPIFSGREASPIKLGSERTRTFPDRKIVLASTPCLETGAIWTALKRSDWRRWWTPCPRCGEFQALTFRPNDELRSGHLRWEKGATVDDIREGRAAVWYECGRCHGRIESAERVKMLMGGLWVPNGLTAENGRVQGEPRQRYHRGYHLSALGSMWVEWETIVAEFLESKHKREELMGFVNSILAEPWIETSEERVVLDPLKRMERYAGTIPKGVLMITVGVDVQDDRLEAEVVGWGIGEESWNLEYFVWYGDPASTEVWSNLIELKRRMFRRIDGVELRVESMAIDSGGHHTQRVYEFVRPRQIDNIWAVKGGSEESPYVIAGKAKTNIGQVILWIIGTRVAKDMIYARLKLDQVGPGFCHFPETRDEDYFQQLTAERVEIRYKKGFMVRSYIKTGRNEALDCRVYAYVALLLLVRGRGIAWDAIKAAHDARAAEIANPVSEETAVAVAEGVVFPSDLAKRPDVRRRSFVKGWR